VRAQILYYTYLLMLWVFRADHVDPSLPENDAAAVAHDLDGRANFHATGECWCVRALCVVRMMEVRLKCLRLGQCSEPHTRNKRPACRQQRAQHRGGGGERCLGSRPEPERRMSGGMHVVPDLFLPGRLDSRGRCEHCRVTFHSLSDSSAIVAVHNRI
jgi:hypothetical protein